MARRHVSVVDVLLVRHWQVSVIAAGFAYAVLAFAVPFLLADNKLAAGFVLVSKSAAPFTAAFFLAIALLSFLRSCIVRRKFDGLEHIQHVRQLSWRQFEAIVGEAFRQRGYRVDESAVDGPDGGIDLVLRKDGARFYVQCKQWKQVKVGVRSIREFYGVIVAGGAAGGFFVASGKYTEEAREFARKCGIELIDGAALVEMIGKSHSPEQRDAIESPVADRTCPVCGGPMVQRTATRGANAGRVFFGCSSYPRCRGTRPA